MLTQAEKMRNMKAGSLILAARALTTELQCQMKEYKIPTLLLYYLYISSSCLCNFKEAFLADGNFEYSSFRYNTKMCIFFSLEEIAKTLTHCFFTLRKQPNSEILFSYDS